MDSPGATIQNDKQRGEWAELRFMARARELGFEVSKPFGESARYDVTVELEGRFLRIQVKSTMARNYVGYLCRLNGARTQNYTAEQIDFFAIYVIPEDVWYILPIEIGMRVKGQIFFMPGRKGQKYAAYEEAWHLLREGLGQPEPAPADHPPLTTGNCPDAVPENIPEMRGAVDPVPAPGFDPDLLRRRLAGCFGRVNRK